MPTLLATPDLTLALQRVAELEAEVRELRSTSTNGHADGANGTAVNGSTNGLTPGNGLAQANGLTTMRLIEVEAMLVRRAMEQHGGNVSRAARQLGLSRSALYRRLDRHKI